jgi:hypothetical protein
VCDGKIGNAPLYDNICLDIDGANCLISGSGSIDISRMRKISTGTTNLTISMNINIWFPNGGMVLLYNNTVGPGIFNVTVSVGSTVNLKTGLPGDISIDGGSATPPSSPAIEAGGTFTINGTLIVSGKLYMANNNVSTPCNWVVNGLLQVSEIVAAASTGTALSTMTVNSGGKLEINGTAAFSTLSTTNNTFSFASGSTVEYSAAGAQTVRTSAEFTVAAPVANQPYDYGHLTLSNSGAKTISVAGTLYVKNNLTISGTAVFTPYVGSSLEIMGSWYDWDQAGFTENGTTVKFTNLVSVGQSINCIAAAGETFNSLTQSSANNILTMNCPVSVLNTFRLNSNFGHLDLNSFPLTIVNSSSAAIIGGGIQKYILSEKTDNSSKVIWKIGVATSPLYTIPFGVLTGAPNTASAANYIPVQIVKTTAANVGDVSISTYGTGAANTPWPTTPTNVTNLYALNAIYNTPDDRAYCADRFWQIDATGAGVLDSLKFAYRTVELPTADPIPANMRAQFWATTFGYWNYLQYGVASVVIAPSVLNIVSVPGFSVYNTAWTLSSIISPLPIKLLGFRATKNENSVLLDWATATEINNQYFNVERSSNGQEFYSIGKLAGAGNSSQQNNYSFDDTAPLPGVSYYRLKQTDYDGTSTYSNTVAVNFKSNEHHLFAFPNPATTSVYLSSDDMLNSEITICDMQGRVMKKAIAKDANDGIYQLDIQELLRGIYTIEVIGSDRREVLRLLKD